MQALLDDPMDNVVQINHINSHFGGGGLGIDTGLVPPQSSVELTERRLDPTLGNAFDASFDSLEVWIGTNGRSGIEQDFLQQNAGDWFNLINQGIVRTGIANSDSHDYRFTRIAARNQIASPVVDPAALSGLAEQLAATVRAGKTVGTNVPLMTLEAAGQYQNEQQRAGLGWNDETTMLLDKDGELTLSVDLSTPAWGQLDRVEFYINNQPARSSEPGSAARYEVCPNRVLERGDAGWQQREVVVDSSIPGASRTEIRATLVLPSVSVDSWIVAMARGSDGVSEPLFPVLPASLDQRSNTTLADLIDGNLGEGGTPAFAFTNPIFIDVGGDGWRPPGINIGSCPDS
jgi:hypothetical protein